MYEWMHVYMHGCIQCIHFLMHVCIYVQRDSNLDWDLNHDVCATSWKVLMKTIWCEWLLWLLAVYGYQYQCYGGQNEDPLIHVKAFFIRTISLTEICEFNNIWKFEQLSFCKLMLIYAVILILATDIFSTNWWFIEIVYQKVNDYFKGIVGHWCACERRGL